MLNLYSGGGSGEIERGALRLPPEEWARLRGVAAKLLVARGQAPAARRLEEMPFTLYAATNSFSDEFCVLWLSVSVEHYVELERESKRPEAKAAYNKIASTLTELGHFIRFITAAVDITSGVDPVATPALAVTSDAVERALSDVEHLLAAGSSPSCVDRVHTALHGYLRALCAGLPALPEANASATQLYGALRRQHPGMAASGPRADDIDKVVRALSSILDTLDTLRNHASGAHPNDAVLDTAEAMLVVNTARTLLRYIDDRTRPRR